MNQQQIMPPQSGNDPVFHVELPGRKGILDKPNPEFLGQDEQLRILQFYGSTIRTPKDEQAFVQNLFSYFKIGFINQSNILSFHTEKHKMDFDIDFDICWIRFKRTLPPGQLTQLASMYKSQIKRHADELFYRAVGTDKSITNERIAQQLSVSQIVNSSMGNNMNPGKSQGFLGKLSSLLR